MKHPLKIFPMGIHHFFFFFSSQIRINRFSINTKWEYFISVEIDTHKNVKSALFIQTSCVIGPKIEDGISCFFWTIKRQMLSSNYSESFEIKFFDEHNNDFYILL